MAQPTNPGGDGSGSTAMGGNGGNNSYLPWHLIPQFKPGETDVNDYSRRLQFLAELWPESQLGQLAPRAAMMCEGTAFQKAIRIDAAKLKANDTTGVRLLVQTLGGIWGRSTTETKYERFEKAIFGTQQKGDESNESYIARHEIQYEDLLSMGLTLEELRAYVLLRNSCLSADDKKRIIVDSAGTLDYKKVISSLQLLGSRFFGELQGGQSKTGQKTKSYDVNHAQDETEPEQTGEVDETILLTSSQDGVDEAAIDQLLQEGDEDALIVQQFEDSIVECLQSDQEVAACYNIYVDARKRVLDRAKGRGFWMPPPKGGKDKGRGKSKSKSFRRRPPLEQRIANSACRICFRQGHWKAECPFKNKPLPSSSSTAPSTSSAFAGVASVGRPGEWDVIEEDEDEPPIHSTLYAAEELCFTSWVTPKRFNVSGESHHKRDNIDIIRRLLTLPSHRKPIRTPSMMKSPPRDPLPKVREEIPGFENVEEGVNVVTSGSFGIVDLGASMSVIGENSWKNLFNQMPPTVQQQIRQAPCTVSFRFGNDSVVQGNQAVYIPIGRYWLKLIIVPSNTPFLIANSVFRKLGAVIDTESNLIHFRKLSCSIRISLSERKLYLLDLLDLILQANRQNEPAAAPMSVNDILQCSTIDSEKPIASESKVTTTCLGASFKTQEPCKSSTTPSGSVRPEVVNSKRSCVVPPSNVLDSHVVSRSGQPPSSIDGRPSTHGWDGQVSSNELCGAGQGNHQVRDSQERVHFLPSRPGCALHDMVLRNISQQPENGTPQVPTLREAPCRGVGEDSSHTSQECCQANVQESGQSDNTSSIVGGFRGGRGALGQGKCPSTGSWRTTTTDVTYGECHGADPEPSECREAQPGIDDPTGANVVDPCVQTDLWEQIHQIMSQERPSEVIDSHPEEVHQVYSKNWVAEEMWEYMSSKGFTLDHQRASHVKSLLLEVYCSQDSELTKQAHQQGSAASRFGLRDGDLATFEGRRNLYDRVMQVLPRDIWMSPSCRAWCRWNIFNMHRSIESAKRVIEARERDSVHLLLCDALFQFQQWRSPQCHAHLEQPQGSQMIHREEMSNILATTDTARCDMCVAGQLRNPETGEFLKKGTQVLTTSAILARALGQLKCSREHTHCPIAGSYKDKSGKTKSLVQFTELYTRVFARKTIRMMQCSAQVSEPHFQNLAPRDALFEAHTAEENGDHKRRRVGEKQPPPPSYEAMYREQAFDKLLTIALSNAPKVGKHQFSSGEIIQQLSEMFPTHQIVGAEVCKGADRRRVPFVGITKQTAPLRLSIGTHRNMDGHFCDETWEDWTQLSRKNLIRNCPPSRMLITVFARLKALEPSSSSTVERPTSFMPDLESQSGSKRNPEDSSVEEHRDSKRVRIQTDDSPETCSEGNLPIAEHGPRFAKLPENTQREIIKIHKNLGHPDNKLLQRVLRDQKWEPEIVDSIGDFQCPACFETQRPKLARPGHLTESREFNDLVLIDGIKWTNKTGKQFYFVHMLDAGTNFQVAFLSDDRSSKSMIEGIKLRWFAWAGPPRQLMSDSAGEFCSDEFGQFLQRYNCRSIVIPAEAHWQLGRCERHGAILQHMLEKYEIEHPIDSDEALTEALVQCTMAKNSLSRHRGYSPEILVLGKASQIPGCNSNEDQDASRWDPEGDITHEGESTVFQKNLQRRETARQAFIAADHSHKIRRAILRRSRPSRDNFQRGQWVMYWRNGQGSQKGGWNGPAKILMIEDKNVIWVTHSSRLYRCAPEHLRMLSTREATGTQDDRTWTLPSTTGTGVFQFTDLSHQSVDGIPFGTTPPTNPDLPNMGAPEVIPGEGLNVQPDMPTENQVGGNTPPLHSQPDAEPEVASVPSQGHSEIETPIDGTQVPIPATDSEVEGAFTVMWDKEYDHWEILPDRIVRHHKEPRYRLFCPTFAQQCPVPLEWLTPHRQTDGKFWNHHSWKRTDEWYGNPEVVQNLPLHWFGSTSFFFKPEHCLNETQRREKSNKGIGTPKFRGIEMSIDMSPQDLSHCCKQEMPEQIAFLASSMKKQRSEVKERDLTPGELELFLQAKNKEIKSWISTETVRKIARNQIPAEQILRSRWVLTWKPVDSPSEGVGDSPFKPKARLVILGFEDPQLEMLDRDAPTLGRDSRMLILQYAASARFAVKSFDIQTAFLRGSRQDGRVLGMEPPEEMRTFMNLEPWECCELLKSAYGLVNAPLLWYEELRSSMVALGFLISPLDPCVFVLPKSNNAGIHGLVGIHVDDGLAAGDATFEVAIQRLEQKYPFGSKKEGAFCFTGIQLHQMGDSSIHLDQTKYVEDIPAIEIDRSRRLQGEQLVNEKERQQLRGLIGSLQYAATNTRPDVSARLSFLQSRITTACVRDLLDANRLLHDAKQHKDTKLIIKPIPLEDVRFVSFSDASFATRSNAQSQKGCLIVTASKQIGHLQQSDISPLLWYSKKIARVVGSTLASEAYALSGAVDLLSWLRIHWSWICSPSDNWKDPEACLRSCPVSYAVVDCKSLFDLIQKTTVPQAQEYRTTLEALIIKDRLKEGIEIKWVHSAAQMADALTKTMDCTSLRAFLRHGKCIIHDVDEILKGRADKKVRKQWTEQSSGQNGENTKGYFYTYGENGV